MLRSFVGTLLRANTDPLTADTEAVSPLVAPRFGYR
jgi:hypothetical protein